MSFIDSIDRDLKLRRKDREYVLLVHPYEVVPASRARKTDDSPIRCRAQNRAEAEVKFTMMCKIDPTCLLGRWSITEMELIKKSFN